VEEILRLLCWQDDKKLRQGRVSSSQSDSPHTHRNEIGSFAGAEVNQFNRYFLLITVAFYLVYRRHVTNLHLAKNNFPSQRLHILWCHLSRLI